MILAYSLCLLLLFAIVVCYCVEIDASDSSDHPPIGLSLASDSYCTAKTYSITTAIELGDVPFNMISTMGPWDTEG